MSQGRDPLATTLRPVFDTYMDAAVSVVGCWASGMQRETCEVDALVVTDETRPPLTVKYGDGFFDLYFISEKEALRPNDPQLALSIAASRPVRDSALVLSTGIASNQAMFGANARRAAKARLASCLKALTRADKYCEAGAARAGSYWLLSASYDFAYSWLYSMETIPSPSHLLRQLRGQPGGGPQNLEAFSLGAALARSSRRACAARLESVSVLYDILDARSYTGGSPGGWTAATGFQVTKRKADTLASAMEHAESYCFLGNESARLLLAVSATSRSDTAVSDKVPGVAGILREGAGGLLSDRLVRDIGLERPPEELKAGIKAVRARVAKLSLKA